jgi:hypothetical protein
MICLMFLHVTLYVFVEKEEKGEKAINMITLKIEMLWKRVHYFLFFHILHDNNEQNTISCSWYFVSIGSWTHSMLFKYIFQEFYSYINNIFRESYIRRLILKAVWRTAKSPSAVNMNMYFLTFYQAWPSCCVMYNIST